MATLVSAGVDVEIVNESFYATAGAGTVPLIVIATASNKPAASGNGTAPFTVSSQAGKLFLATSQRELLANFGNPTFHSVQGTQVHGHELNEYGLHAAYSFLGISNRCYVVRADLDMSQLEASVTPPTGNAVAGTYWLDTTNTQWGLFRSNGAALAGNAWTSVPVLVTTPTDLLSNVPKAAFGTNGSFAVVPQTGSNFLYEKIAGSWYQIGSSGWKSHKLTVVTGSVYTGTIPNTSGFSINGTNVTLTVNPSTVTDIATAINAAAISNITAANVSGALTITNAIGGSIVLANGAGNPLALLGLSAGTVHGNTVYHTADASYPIGSTAGDLWVKGTTPNKGANWVVRYFSAATNSFVLVSAPFYAFDSTLVDGNVLKDATAISKLGNPVVGTVYVGFDPTTGTQQLRRWGGASFGWAALVYEADPDAPTTAPADGTYWFDNAFNADIMVSNGSQWLGYRHLYAGTDVNGVQLTATAPTTQSNGTTPLVTNDLWIDTSDTENYPMLYRFDASALRWRLIDKTDHTTPFGIVFGDARSNSGPAFTGMTNAAGYTYNSTLITDMVLSDYLDPDAPDPELHPANTLLFNTRYSSNNVKVWKTHYFSQGGYDPNTDFTTTSYNVGNLAYTFPAQSASGTWVTASGNDYSGVAYMGRKAQRAVVVKAMAAVIDSNQEIRSEFIFYNLIAAPGYSELLSDLVTLNTDQKEVSFIVGDTPIRLKPNGTDLQNWATNAANVASDGEAGLVTANEYVSVHYPWGLGQDNFGNSVMIPPSTIALRVMAYNDQVAYPWFAPAGYTRGLVTNASSVGYLDTDGSYVPVILNHGQRDVLYVNKINPIAYIPARGLVVFGQKTLAPVASALDRINVARLVNYIKYNLNNILQPYLFEQNDAITRTSAKHTVESFLNNLVGLRGLVDYAVLCDTTNNTADRIDRNELWIDCLIRPEKAIEFIYVPVRILTTGANLNF